MSMIDIDTLTIQSAHTALKKRKYSAVDLARAYLARIQECDKDTHAFLEIFDDVLKQAEEADILIQSGNGTLFTGIPLAVKDNILIKDRIASSASKMLEKYVAPYDATVIAKLKKERAVFVGRTNMDEFAMGGSTENSAFGVTKNPHDASRVAGGSSGGSAAAVSFGGALVALGSDTGGSIRQPASFCGVVGLKPTYGSVSRYGVMAMGSSLDQIGTFGKTVDDTEALFSFIRGHDVLDSTSVPDKFQTGARKEKKKFTIGVPEDFLTEGIDVGVSENFYTTVNALKNMGHMVKTVSLPHLKYALAVYYIIMPAEASTNLARFDGVRYGLFVEGDNLFQDYTMTRGRGFGAEVRRRIMLGTYVLSAGYYDAYYNKAMAVRELIKKDFTDAFENIDAIVTPTSPVPAFTIGERAHDPLQMYLADIFTVPVNIAGIPGISIPSGFVRKEDKKLPVGFQILAPRFHEQTLFALGRDVEMMNG